MYHTNMVSEKKRVYNHEWYMKHRIEKIKRVQEHQKANNYASEKTPKARALRNIKRCTRQKYSLKNKQCELCKCKAEEHHHIICPITVDDYVYICHRCHALMHRERGDTSEKTGIRRFERRDGTLQI